MRKTLSINILCRLCLYISSSKSRQVVKGTFIVVLFCSRKEMNVCVCVGIVVGIL
jgi:type III secretory pathway component EscS